MNIEILCENIYEDLEGYISAIESTYMGISFIYETDHWDDFDKRIKLKIECEGVAESTLNIDAGGSFQLFTKHPVLDEYLGDSGVLYFSSKPENPNEIIGLLYSEHESYFGDWRDLSKYLNTNIPFSELLSSGNGSLANAPINVLEIYKNAVSDYLNVNIVKSHKNDGGFKMLVVENTYIVCKSISVKYC
ncbi:hypothetical protein [Thalassomonas actiniarum]|uniref:Uncharacterized protein n=1 Tax=Thalassomonas actiniarum TaxID=485447 RepID=A0AAE9YS46_9GAMM|nr:hypothetical protein [Thalassomonas actiniarum]WDD99288.1 hypothetical protein SG35_000945 [Thalassomonas actiniarum]